MSENERAGVVVNDLRRDLAHFEPRKTQERLAKAKAVIAYCAQMKDWPALDHAVGLKIEEEADYVAWYKATVRPNHRPELSVADRGYLTAADVEEQTNISPQQVARWVKALRDRDRYFSKVVCATCRAIGLEPPENHRAEGTGDNEWFTPPRYIEAAREVMGGIDLDPATHPLAQATVRASHFFTRADNGLKQDWCGRVWMNPPYTQPLIEQFVNKLAQEVTTGRVVEAIALTHNYTDTAWFHAAARTSALICFTLGRIKFVDIDGEPCAPTQGQAFFYFGEKTSKFRDVFGAFGFVR